MNFFRRTPANPQVTSEEPAKQMGTLSGSNQSNRSGSNQPYHASAQATALGNTVEEELNQERAGSSKKPSSAGQGLKNVHSSTSIGDTSGQARVATPKAPVRVQTTGSVTTTRSSGSVATPAATGKASSGEVGKGNQGSTQNNRSRPNQPDYANAQATALENPVKDQLDQRGGGVALIPNNSGQTRVRTSQAPASVQATGAETTARSSGSPAATGKASSGEMGKGNQGSTQSNRSRSNQPDHVSAQACTLENQVKGQLSRGAERVGPPNEFNLERSRTIDSSTSIGDRATGQARVGTTHSPASAQATGSEITVQSSGSGAAPAAARKASPGEMGKGNQGSTQNNRSRSSQPGHADAQATAPENPVKDQLNQREGRADQAPNNSGQGPVRTPLPVPTSVHATGVNTTTRSPGSVAAPAVTEKASTAETGKGNQGSTQSNRSRSNQAGHANTQAAALENPVKDQLNRGGGRAGSTPNELSSKRLETVNSSTSLGDSSGQGPVGITLSAPTSVQVTGAETTARSLGSVITPAATGKASSAEIGKRDQVSSQINRSRSNQPDHPSAQAAAFENPVKDQWNRGAERVGIPNEFSSERSRIVNSPTSIGDRATGQARVGTAQSPASAQATGAEITVRSSGSGAAPATARKASSGEMGEGNQGSTQINRSRLNQSDHVSAQAGALENQVKGQLNRGVDKVDPQNKLSLERSRTSTSIGDTTGQALVGAPQFPASAQADGAETTAPSSGSVGTPAATRKATSSEMGKGNQGSTQNNRLRSNQPDHTSAQAGVLQDQVKDHLNQRGERVGSQNELSLKRSSTVGSSTSTGDTSGQGPVGNPLPSTATSVQATGAEKTARSPRSVTAPAATGKASSGEMGKADVTREVVDLGKPTKSVNTYPSKPGSSGNSTPISPTLDPVRIRGAPVKPLSANAQDEHQVAQAGPAAEDRERVGARAGNTRKGGGGVAFPGVVRSEERDPHAQPSVPPMRPPDHSISRSNTRNSLPPEGVGSRERGQGDVDNTESSGDGSSDSDDNEETSEDAGLERWRRHELRKQQEPQPNYQMHSQQRQPPEVAYATTPKSHASRLAAVSGIGVGGSSDESRRSGGISLSEKLADMELSLQHSTRVIMDFDHHHRKLQARADAQGEQLQTFQHQLLCLHDDNRSLRHELKAVNLLLEDAKNQTLRLQMLLSEVGGTDLKGAQIPLAKADSFSTNDVVQKANEGGAWETSGGSNALSIAAAIQKIDVLNTEIFRVAAAVGKTLQKAGFDEGAYWRITQISEKAKAMLGENMAALLASGLLDRANRVNPLLGQVVFQVAITNWCKMTVSLWKPNSDASNSLAELYSRTREVESPTSPGRRRRSVTWAQLQFSSDDWSQDLLDGLLSILIFTGWCTPNSNQQNMFEEQFPPIFKAIVDLRKALGEDIRSIDMEVAAVDPGTIFDSAYMDNGWPALTRENTSEIVSGTTGLGLKKVLLGLSPQGRVPKADIIYRPKIVLERTVKEALIPPSSPLSPQRKGPLGRGRDGWD